MFGLTRERTRIARPKDEGGTGMRARLSHRRAKTSTGAGNEDHAAGEIKRCSGEWVTITVVRRSLRAACAHEQKGWGAPRPDSS